MLIYILGFWYMFSLFSALVMTLVPLYKFIFFGPYFIEFGVYYSCVFLKFILEFVFLVLLDFWI